MVQRDKAVQPPPLARPQRTPSPKSSFPPRCGFFPSQVWLIFPSQVCFFSLPGVGSYQYMDADLWSLYFRQPVLSTRFVNPSCPHVSGTGTAEYPRLPGQGRHEVQEQDGEDAQG